MSQSNPTKPILPDSTDITKISPELSRYLFEMEEYTEKLLQQKLYYRRLANMLCSDIEAGEFSGTGFREEAAALKHYGICV